VPKGKGGLIERLKKVPPCSECRELRGMVLVEENGGISVGYCYCMRGRLLRKLAEKRELRQGVEV
jgi:hypothetical protein